jgi:hypothetical protein
MSSDEFEQLSEKKFRELAPLVEEHYKHHAAKSGL